MILFAIRVPAGKHLIKFLILNVPYKIKYDMTTITDKVTITTTNNKTDWSDIKERYGDHIIEMITEKYFLI
jgi:hypothetical protein